MPTITATVLSAELQNRGFEVTFTQDDSLVLISKGSKTFFLHDAILPSQGGSNIRVVRDKYLSKIILDRNKIPTAPWVKVNRSTIDRASTLQFPVVIKPTYLYGGMGVVVGVQSVEEIRNYLEENPQYSEVLIEETLIGPDIRILIVQGKFFAAVSRVSPTLTGDGTSTVTQLLAVENQFRTQQKVNQEKTGVYKFDLDPIRDDKEIDITLGLSGYSRESIFPAGEKVAVRRNSNVSSGGTSIDVTDSIGTELRQQSELIAKAFGVTILGIDVMTTDPSKPLDYKDKSGVVEVNASPGIGLHLFPISGVSRNPVPLICDEIVAYCT